MTITSAIILGLVQGLTEFLPVSSSAHLIIIPSILNMQTPSVAFDVVLHLATALAVIVFFHKDILNIITKDHKMFLLLIIGTVPTGIMGLLFKDFFEAFFQQGLWIGLFLIITGIILWFAEHTEKESKPVKSMTWFDAIIIGTCQGCAILPGISRSGSTVAAGLFRGLPREFAAKFAFLLSIPAIMGAGLMKARDIASIPLIPSLIGFIFAFFSGLLAIKIFIELIKNKNLKYFSLYCLVLGLVIILI